MLSNFLDRSIVRSTALAERSFSGKHAVLKIAMLWFALAAFIAYPDWDLVIRAGFLNGRGPLVWGSILKQSAHPFAITHYDPASHEAKMALRLLPPIIGHVLGLNPIGFFLFQVASYIGFCYLATRLILRASGDIAITVFAAIGCAASGLGSILAIDTSPFFDSVGFVFIALAMLSANPASIIGCFVLAGFTDERCIITIPMVFLFHCLRGGTAYPNTIWHILKANVAAWSAIVAAPIYLLCRMLVTYATGLFTPHAPNELNYLFENFSEWPIALWSVFEGGWILVLGGLLIFYLRKAYLLLIFAILAMLPSIIAGWMVIDMTRSLCFIFPILLLTIGVICANERRPRTIFFYAMIVSLLFPSYAISGGQRPHFMVPTIIAPLQWIPLLYR